jgi:hypothetical protein
MSTVNFDDKIFVQEAMQAFTAGLAPLSAFSRSFSDQTASKGDAIAIPRVDVMATTTFDYDNNDGFPYEGAGGTINTITINLDKHQIVNADITDIQFANSSAAQITNFAQQQGRALARKVLTDIFGILSITNFGAGITTASSGFDTGLLIDARKAMVDRRVPADNLALVASSEMFANLLKDGNVRKALEFGGSEAIRDANIPRLLGMNLYETNALGLGGTLSLVGFLAHPDGIACAIRALQPQDSTAYLAVESVTDDETGITMTYRRHFNPGRGKHFANFECLYGFTSALTLGIGLIRRT